MQIDEKADLKWMERALELAEKAYGLGEVPVGAVLVKEDSVLGEAHNLKESRFDPTAHAEILALRQASETAKSWRVLDADLYVTLEPCPMCLAALQQSRVRRVIFGTKDLKGGAISLGYSLHADPRLNHQFSCELNFHARAEALLKSFFLERRRK